MRLSENAGCDNVSYARFGNRLRRVYAHAWPWQRMCRVGIALA